MSVNINNEGGAGTNDISRGTRSVVRTSAGIPYVVMVGVNTGTFSIEVWKGNGTTPTSFSQQDTSNDPQSNQYLTSSAVIDSNDIIHIIYVDTDTPMNGGGARYVTFDTSDDTFSGDALIDGWIDGPSNEHVSIAIDSNDIPHVAYVDSDANMGTSFETIMYNNRIGGSWNTSSTEIEGFTNEKDCSSPAIAINADDLPVIAYINDTDSDVAAALGDANDPSSFTLTDPEGSVTVASGVSIAVDDISEGDTWIAFVDGGGTVRVRESPSTWTNTWGVLDSNNTGINPSIAVDGFDIYIFYENGDDDIAYDVYSAGWAGETVLETGTYSDVLVRWGFWVDNDSAGALTTEAVYYFDDSSPTDNNSNWNNDVNAFDGDTGTEAQATADGPANWLKGDGTNAPSSGGTIRRVLVRAFAEGQGGPEMNHRIFIDGGAEELGTAEGGGSSSVAAWGDWVELSTPTGGWSWDVLQNLEVRIHSDQSSTLDETARTEIKVFTREDSTELDYVFDAGPDILFSTLVFGGGGTPDNDERNFRLVGTANITDTRNFILTGGINDDDERNFILTGQVLTSNTRNFILTGTANITDTRNFILTGGIDVSNTRNFILTGEIATSDTRNFILTGQVSTSNTRNFILTGVLTANDTRNFILTGQVLDSDTRNFRLHGIATISNTRNFILTGDIDDNDTRNFILTGQVLTSNTRNFILTGDIDVNNERGFKTTGVEIFPVGWTLQYPLNTVNAEVTGSSDFTDFQAVIDQNQITAGAFANSQGNELNTNYLLNDPRLKGYWRLADLLDETDNDNDLVNNNVAVFEAAYFGNGVSFVSASSQSLTISDANQTGLDITGDISITARFRLDSLNVNKIIVSKYDYATTPQQRSYELLVNSGNNISFKYSGDGDGSGNQATFDLTDVELEADVWYHIVIVCDVSATTVTMYLNGQKYIPSNSGASPTSIFDGTAPFSIGSQHNNGAQDAFMDGDLDDVGVFDGLLTETEANTLWAGGADVRFSSDEAGTNQLAHEIVEWDVTNLRAIVWIKIPLLEWDSDTPVYLWAGKSDAVKEARDLASFGSESVWSGGYVGVWHLHGSGADSTSNRYDLKNLTQDPPKPITAGKVGNAMLFDDANSEYLTIPSADSANLQISGNQVWQVWMARDADVDNKIMGIRASGGGTARFIFYADSAGGITEEVAFRLDGLTDNEVYNGSKMTDTDVFRLFTGKYDGTDISIFVNGTKTAEASTGSLTALAQPFSIGRAGAHDVNYVSGPVDEARIINGTRSDDWVDTVHNNQNSPTTFWRLGTNVDDERNFRLVGQILTSDTRNFILTGTATTSNTRNFILTGGINVNDTRNFILTGIFAASNERNFRLTGTLNANDTRNFRLVGTLDDSDTRNFIVTGFLTDSDTRNFILTGDVDTNNERGFKLTGISDIPDDDERNFRLVGQVLDSDTRNFKLHGIDTISNTRNFILTGFLTANDTRNFRLHGIATISNTRNFILTGFLTDSDTRNFRLHGIATISNTRNFILTGFLTDNDIRNFILTGNVDISNTRNFKITGVATLANDTRNFRIVGQASTNDERNFRLIGGINVSDTRNFILTGVDTISNTRNFILTGDIDTNDTRNFRLTGVLGANDTRNFILTGDIAVDNTRNFILTGIDTTSNTRNFILTGVATTDNTRNFIVTGFLTSNNTRNFILTGSADISNTRNFILTGTATISNTRNFILTGGINVNAERGFRLTGAVANPVPADVILPFPGTHANIPLGFVRETSLDTKYIKGAANGVNGGGTGGNANHSHSASANHGHTLNSHTHTILLANTGGGGQGTGSSAQSAIRDVHKHGDPSFTSGAPSGGSLSSIASTYANVSNDPPFYEVIFIKSLGINHVPDETIALWDNTDSLPSNWFEADGNNSTVDLQDKFLKGAVGAGDSGSTGGSTTNVHDLTHTHTVASHTHVGANSNGPTATQSVSSTGGSTIASNTHVHSVSLNATTGTLDGATIQLNTTETVEPAFKKLMLVQNKTGSAELPLGTIGLWLGTIASIPVGWVICDGNNTTQDMRDKWLKAATGSGQVGDTGGSNTHTHASQNHTHIASATHTHSAPTVDHTGLLSLGHTGSGAAGANAGQTHGTTIGTATSVYANGSTAADSANNEPPYTEVIYIKYIGTPANDTRNFRLHGIAEISDTRNFILTGGINVNDTRNFKIHGKALITNTRNFILTGTATANNTRNFRLTGILGANDTRNFILTGFLTANNTRNFILTGGINVNNERNFKLHGIDTISNTRNFRITGIPRTANDERNFIITGLYRWDLHPKTHDNPLTTWTEKTKNAPATLTEKTRKAVHGWNLHPKTH